MKPYYEHAGIQLWHGHCLEIPLPFADRVVTDPPYGVEGGHGGQLLDYRKADYAPNFEDSPKYIREVVVPMITHCIANVKSVVVTPGIRCCFSYPQPDDMGCFFQPATARIGKFGFQSMQPILYYGEYINRGKGSLPTGIQLTESAEQNGHPCPKPYSAWRWLVSRSALPGETVLDPFCGSGTTLRAAKDLGMKAIGIELEERYCEIAAKRLSQEVFNFGDVPGESGRHPVQPISSDAL